MHKSGDKIVKKKEERKKEHISGNTIDAQV